jgi:hypothetical protein
VSELAFTVETEFYSILRFGYKHLNHIVKVKVKISLFQAVEAHRVARG